MFRVPVYMTLYLLIYGTYIAWNEVTYDEAVYMSKMASPLGITIMILRALIGMVFVHSVCHTITKHGTKARFYRKFMAFGVTWIWIFPIVLLICGIILVCEVGGATLYIDGVVMLFQVLPMLGIQTGMLMLYDPTCKFNKKFPFHAKVTEMKKMKKATVKIVGGSPDEEEGAGEPVFREIELTEEQIRMLQTKIDTASFRLERVVESVGYLQTEIDDLETIGFADDSTLRDVADADMYTENKPRKRRGRRSRGKDENSDDGDEEDGKGNGRRRRRRPRGGRSENNSDSGSNEDKQPEEEPRKRRSRRQRRPRGDDRE